MLSHDPVPSRAHRLALLLGLVVLAALSLLPLRPPPPADASAPPEAFSAARAFEHVAALATEPHPAGTEAHAAVRRELTDRLRALGLEPTVQEVLGARRDAPGRLRSAWSRNVLARVEGSGGGDDAVLLVAHYDSIPAGPGASDDAAGVAALLETLRALTVGEPPRHDVIALFSDAEELGLLGAQGFVDAHPWADDVRLVVNLEARGVSGPSIMFETGPGTGALLGRFADASRRPLAASYSYDVYRLLPNDTDFSVFRPKGRPGFNFAFIGDAGRYHTALDTPENLSRASLQHHGEQALGLARGFADADDLDALPRAAPAVYFALPGLGLVRYPGVVARVLGLLAALAALALLAVAARRGRFSFGSAATGALWALGAVLLGLLGAFALHFLAARLFAPLGLLPRPGLYLAGLAAVAAALASWVLLRRRGDLLGGVVLLWAVLTAAAALALPSTSYLMLWPLVGLTAALAVEVFLPAGRLRSWGRVAVLLVAALPALWLWTPTLVLIAEALRAMGPGPPAVSLLAALLTTLLAPQLAVIAGAAPGSAGEPMSRGRRWLPLALGLLGLVLLGTTLLGRGPTPANPYPTHVAYALDADTGEARWVTLERRISPWTRQFVGDAPEPTDLGFLLPQLPFPARAATAPAVALPPLEVVDRGAADGGRRRLLHLRSPLGGHFTRLRLHSESTITGLRLAERDLDAEPVDGAVLLSIGALPAEGLPLEVTLDAPGELVVETADLAYGLPEVPGLTPTPRPADRMPSPFLPTDYRVVGKRYTVPGDGAGDGAGVDDAAPSSADVADGQPS